jgi:hypothetical protein
MLGVTALAATLLVATGAPGYKHVGGKSGVEVFRQMDSPAIDLMAEGDFEGPPSAVLGVILDYDHARDLSDRVRESKILQGGDHEVTTYQRLDLPIVSDRDYTLHIRYGKKGDGRWTRFAVDNGRGPAPRKGVVRVSTLSGSWDLLPIRGGTATHAIYKVQIDMAGSIPKWMVSGGAAKDLPKLFEGVRKKLRARQMAGAEPPKQPS